MSLLAAVGIGTKIFGGLRKRKAGKKMDAMAREQEIMAQEAATLERRELAETVRRTDLQNTQTMGRGTAIAAASGVKSGGTADTYLNFLQDEQTTQLNWLQDAGASRIEQNLKGNLLQAQGTRLEADNMRTGFLTDMVGALGMAGDAGFFETTKKAPEFNLKNSIDTGAKNSPVMRGVSGTNNTRAYA